MRRTAIKLLFFVVLLFISGKSSFAIDPNATGSAVVTAEIISQEFNPSTLISPSDNSTTNNPREALVWKRPSPLPATPLHHYDVYLDGQVFAASVSDSITSQVYYYYTIRRDNDTFYLDTNFDFAQGYHTWKVVAYTTAGTSASSETRTFYIDSIYPFITLKKVDRQTLNWSTTDLTTIPDINQRDLTVTAVNPLLTGSVEPYANMQFILICPQNILNCTNQIYQGNYPTGSWQHRFYGLIRGLVYTVYLSATDAGGHNFSHTLSRHHPHTNNVCFSGSDTHHHPGSRNNSCPFYSGSSHLAHSSSQPHFGSQAPADYLQSLVHAPFSSGASTSPTHDHVWRQN
ncbi:MAG: hypothetical protein UV30_C0022G0003 [Candidatus Collierbacteria bacterium GW2011_GWF1_42_50]|nr:MAG: hypothetical protein UV30_C0022G0003 [Candidatus Collierbacteria bacterium GW2011_GWF1_42_50]